MDELISRQDAIDALERKQSHVERPITETRWFDLGLKKAQEVLSELPSAQPEIIRCKDCKWYGRVDKRRFYRGMDCLQKRIDTIVPDRDFCSKAERRGEQDDSF